MFERFITVKVFRPGNKNSSKLRVRAPRGKMFTEQGIQSVLKQVADRLEVEYPNDEFELKELTGHQFNFVWVGPKAEATLNA